MGKRSRKPSGGPSPATRAPKAPRQASSRAVEPATSTARRLKQSWKLAGERPAAKGGMQGVGREVERPDAIWAPVPVNEIFNLLGVILIVVGLTRGQVDGQSALILGAVLCAISAFELSLREHLSGFKAHSLLLSILVAAALGILVVLIGGRSAIASLSALVVVAVAFGLGIQGWSRLYAQRRRRALQLLR